MFTFARKGKYILMRTKYIMGFSLALLLLVAACRPKYSPRPVWVVKNDFEDVPGWVNNSSNNSHTVVAGDAHSGRYAYMIDNAHTFGYYYRSRLKDISDKKISWIKVSGYCKAKSDKLNKAAVVCNIEDETHTYKFWGEAFLEYYTEGKKDKWVYFEKSFNINAASKPEYYLGAFVWSPDTTDRVLVDDFKIEFFD